MQRPFLLSALLFAAAISLPLASAYVSGNNITIPSAAYFGRWPASTFHYEDCAVVDLAPDASASMCEFLEATLDEGNNAECVVGVLEKDALANVDCHSLPEMLTAIKNTKWVQDIGMKAIVFAVEESKSKCLGSPFRGCVSNMYLSQTFRVYDLLPPAMDLAIVLEGDWHDLVDSFGQERVQVTIVDEPGQWNEVGSGTAWITFCVFIVAVNAVVILIAIPTLIEAIRGGTLIFNSRTVMFFSAAASGICIAIFSYMTYPMWLRIMFSTYADAIFTVAYFSLLSYWSKLSRDIVPLIVYRSLSVALYVSITWTCVRTTWTTVGWFVPSVSHQERHWVVQALLGFFDYSLYVTAALAFVIIASTLARNYRQAFSRRSRRPLLILSLMTAIGGIGYLVQFGKVLFKYQSYVLQSAVGSFAMEGITMFVYTARVAAALLILRVQLPENYAIGQNDSVVSSATMFKHSPSG